MSCVITPLVESGRCSSTGGSSSKRSCGWEGGAAIDALTWTSWPKYSCMDDIYIMATSKTRGQA
eukprot:4360656-Prorocentrum_lima.AAC.1